MSLQVLKSINEIRRRGGDVHLLRRSWSVDGESPKSQATAFITLPMPRPNGQGTVISAQGEVFPTTRKDIETHEVTSASAYWVAIDNLQQEFAQALKNTRAGIKDKRIETLSKAWITPLTEKYLKGVTHSMGTKNPSWAVQVFISHKKSRYAEQRVYDSIEASTCNLAAAYATGFAGEYLEALCKEKNHEVQDYVIKIGYTDMNDMGIPPPAKKPKKKAKGIWNRVVDMWEEVPDHRVPKLPALVPKVPPYIPPIIKPFHCPIHTLCATTVSLDAATQQVEL